MESLATRGGGGGQPQIVVEDDRTGMHPVTLERAVLDHLYYTCMKDPPSATLLNVYEAVAHATRDRLVQRWIRTQRAYYEQNVKRVTTSRPSSSWAARWATTS
ncbi:MAG: hypothetical protein U0168_11540 [Nannocystaceae bacterium]